MSVNRDLLKNKAHQLRVDSVRATTAAGSGHPTSCLSSADLVAALFFGVMRFNPHNPKQPNNDRFILSKGHAAPLLYAAWKHAGVISDGQLLTLRQIDSVLEGHPTYRFYYAEAATGSLGCGLSIGLGMQLAARLDKKHFYTYVLLGDSECAEGSVWEAAELASYYKINRLIALVDINRLGQTGATIDGYTIEKYEKKFSAFGWNTISIDGHDMDAIVRALNQARESTGKPTVILAKTIKGYGVSWAEDKEGFHGRAFKEDELENVLADLEKKVGDAVNYDGEPWTPNPPEVDATYIMCTDFTLPIPHLSGKISTRKAYGQALTLAGSVCENVVCLDAEVNNSTYAELFKDQHPFRFIQCFVAEQNMVGMGIGFANRKKIPFISTFGAFFTRAFDQIRMAALSKAPLRLVGSHAGVSVGQDGPSQMGLEDISMMRTVRDSVIFYPSDAVSTYRLVQEMANHHESISYLRTTRKETDILYSPTEEFKIGECKVLKNNEQASALVVAAGITVHEALKAEQMLKKEGISISIIDLYCIKPLDKETLLKVARNSDNKIITVEDHYLEGGLGEAVVVSLSNEGITFAHLAVTEIPRSGKPEELLQWAGIDAEAILKTVKNLI